MQLRVNGIGLGSLRRKFLNFPECALQRVLYFLIEHDSRASLDFIHYLGAANVLWNKDILSWLHEVIVAHVERQKLEVCALPSSKASASAS